MGSAHYLTYFNIALEGLLPDFQCNDRLTFLLCNDNAGL